MIVSKRFFLTASFVLLTFPSYSYIVGQNLIIDNQTEDALTLSINRPNGQSPLSLRLAAGDSTEVYLENGDYSGFLGQLSQASFILTNPLSKRDYVNGNVSFYVGGLSSRFSFLNTVQAGSGLRLQTSYSCANGGVGTVFNNKVVISGNALSLVEKASVSNRCLGLLSSSYDEITETYSVQCSDGRQMTFKRKYKPTSMCYKLNNGTGSGACYMFDEDNNRYLIMPNFDHPLTYFSKELLDKQLGESYCGTASF